MIPFLPVVPQEGSSLKLMLFVRYVEAGLMLTHKVLINATVNAAGCLELLQTHLRKAPLKKWPAPLHDNTGVHEAAPTLFTWPKSMRC